MSTGWVMHEGHRQRMYEKLKKDSCLLDHEILEMFLFNGLPRINTNTIAHSLIEAFGSLAGVFEADVKQLTSVRGVGESTALYIKCASECMRRLQPINVGITKIVTIEDVMNFTVARMHGRIDEAIEVYCLEKNGKVKRIFTFTDSERNKVEVSADEISYIIATAQPYGILIAHNHLSGNSAPSANDDRFTAEMQLLCSINNVILLDHCIYASDTNVYSYYASGKIDGIRHAFSFKKVIDNQINISSEEIKKQQPKTN